MEKESWLERFKKRYGEENFQLLKSKGNGDLYLFKQGNHCVYCVFYKGSLLYVGRDEEAAWIVIG